jgi:hypothetical protein
VASLARCLSERWKDAPAAPAEAPEEPETTADTI